MITVAVANITTFVKTNCNNKTALVYVIIHITYKIHARRICKIKHI